MKFAQAQTVTAEFGEINIAPPEFVLLYKSIFRRNKRGKQDDQDIERLKGMGLISDSLEVGRTLYKMSGRNPVLTDNLLQEIYSS